MNRKGCTLEVERFLERKCSEGVCVADDDLYYDFLNNANQSIARNTNKNSFLAKVRFVCLKHGWVFREGDNSNPFCRKRYELSFKQVKPGLTEFQLVVKKV